MTFESWILFALAITVASFSPGPNVLIVVVKTLTNGTRGAVFTILGNLACLFLVALLASIGVGAVIATAPVAYTIMKIAGGLYLCWMGFKIIKNSFGKAQSLDIDKQAENSNKETSIRLFFEAFLTSASNPKSILFLTAIFPQFLNVDAAIVPQFGIMFATIIGLVSIIHASYASLAYRLKSRSISIKARQWMARVTGTTFIGLGVGVAVSK